MNELQKLMKDNGLNYQDVMRLLGASKRTVLYWRDDPNHPIPPSKLQLLKLLMERRSTC